MPTTKTTEELLAETLEILRERNVNQEEKKSLWDKFGTIIGVVVGCIALLGSSLHWVELPNKIEDIKEQIKTIQAQLVSLNNVDNINALTVQKIQIDLVNLQKQVDSLEKK